MFSRHNVLRRLRNGPLLMDLYRERTATMTRHAAVGINDDFTTVRPQSPIGPPITKRPVGLMRIWWQKSAIQRAESA